MLTTALLLVLLLLQAATLGALLLWLRSYLRDRFGQHMVVQREQQRALQLLGDQLGSLQRSAAEQCGMLERLTRLSQEQARALERQTGIMEDGIMTTQAHTNAEIRELRGVVVALERELAAQAHGFLSHLAWEEVERYIANERTPEAEKDFFIGLRSRRSAAGDRGRAGQD
jgi:hypothetical protein